MSEIKISIWGVKRTVLPEKLRELAAEKMITPQTEVEFDGKTCLLDEALKLLDSEEIARSVAEALTPDARTSAPPTQEPTLDRSDEDGAETALAALACPEAFDANFEFSPTWEAELRAERRLRRQNTWKIAIERILTIGRWLFVLWAACCVWLAVCGSINDDRVPQDPESERVERLNADTVAPNAGAQR